VPRASSLQTHLVDLLLDGGFAVRFGAIEGGRPPLGGRPCDGRDDARARQAEDLPRRACRLRCRLLLSRSGSWN